MGVDALVVDEMGRRARIGDVDLPEGTTITIDGATGAVHVGVVPVTDPSDDERLVRSIVDELCGVIAKAAA